MRPGAIVRRPIGRLRQEGIEVACAGIATGKVVPPTKCQSTWAPMEDSGATPMCDPPLAARDEAIALLHATAEVEHSLMVQYLYAAYSMGEVPPGDPRESKVKLITYLLLHIAREEMAHLATVQNLLRLLGAPLHLDREHSPFSSQLLPFRFKLEPLSLGSLAKYVIAESPRPLPDDGSLSDADRAKIYGEVTDKAKASNDGICVGHVGDIFARLIRLFRERIQDSDFRPDTGKFQAAWDDFGFDPKLREIDGVPIDGGRSIVEQCSGSDPTLLRAAAVAALEKIAEQGEGTDTGVPAAGAEESHFEWFWLLYRTFESLLGMGGAPVRSVPINPNTSTAPDSPWPFFRMVDAGMEAQATSGRITHPRSRKWAQLFNLRYRKLLTCLHHYLRLDTDRYDAQGDRTPRGLLLLGLFDEMRRLKKISVKLMQMPKEALPQGSNTPGPDRAGPPFELPYTTQIPDGESERWSRHLDVSVASSALISEILKDPVDSQDMFLKDLKVADEQDQVVMAELAAGRPAPQQTQDFPKIVRILEEAVRGFSISNPILPTPPRHTNFWANQPRGSDVPGATDGFVNLVPYSGATSIIKRNADGTFDATGSPLVSRINTSMPQERPSIPQSRRDYIKAWISRGCPDSAPPYPGLVRERDPQPEPGPPGPSAGGPSFATQIKPLFRPNDVSCMKNFGGFDLSLYDDVRRKAPEIYARLDAGTMPPDSGRWPQTDIDLFKAWIDAGFPA